MARVTDVEVKEILDTIIDTTPFITAANLIVTEKLGGSDLSSAMLKEIERWLSAHLACSMDPRAKLESLGDGSKSYEGQTDLGLDNTKYGQNVKLLDTTGVLASLGKQAAKVEVLEW